MGSAGKVCRSHFCPPTFSAQSKVHGSHFSPRTFWGQPEKCVGVTFAHQLFSAPVESAREPLFPADFFGLPGDCVGPVESDLEPLLTGNFVQVVNLEAMLQAYIYGQECWCAFLEKNCDVFRSVSFVRYNRRPRDLQEENC